MLTEAVEQIDLRPAIDGRLFLARHGQTEANLHQRISGRMNTPLSAKGWDQALSLLDVLKSVPLCAIYTSTLKRTVDTAGLIASYHRLPIQKLTEFDEIGLGSLEGCALNGSDEEATETLKRWEENKGVHRLDGAEPYASFVDRVSRGLRKVTSEVNGNVLIVGHRNTNEVITKTLLGRHWHQYMPETVNIKNKFLYEFSFLPDRAQITTIRLGGNRHGNRYEGWWQQ